MPHFTVHVTGPGLRSAHAKLRDEGIMTVILGPTTVQGRTPEPVRGGRLIVTIDAADADTALTRVRDLLPGHDVRLRD